MDARERPSGMSDGASESNLHAALHAIRYGIVLLDAQFRAVFVNRAFRRMWRLPDTVADSAPHIRVLLEHGWSQGFYRVQETEHDSYIANRLTQIQRLEGSGPTRLDLQDGRSLLFESAVLPNGQRMLTYADVTPLTEAVATAESANRAKSDFLSGMSHELRTPLNAVIGFAQLLDMAAAGTLTPKQAEFVRYIQRGGEHLLRLIDDVLSFAKLDAGRLPITIQDVFPADLLGDVRPIIEPLALQAGITVDWPDLASFGQPVRADRVRMAQAMLNLLSNAIKYNRPQGRVRIDLHHADGHLHIAVHDEGEGIPYDRQGEIFMPFNRLGREAGEIEGSGLGLALTRRLVETMNGRIGFSSRPGDGSCFWIELPLVAGHSVPTKAPATGHLSTEGQANRVQRGGFSVLYIEDNAPNRVLMRHVMATLPDVRYLEAASGADGVALARVDRPDIIITDINMPDMDGYGVLQALHAAPETKNIPVLALTSDVMPDAILRGRSAGFALYLTKPVDLALLLQGIDRLLRGREI